MTKESLIERFKSLNAKQAAIDAEWQRQRDAEDPKDWPGYSSVPEPWSTVDGNTLMGMIYMIIAVMTQVATAAMAL